jgi:ornithine carbamoyltransferase
LLEGRSFTRSADWSREELLQVLDLADELKRKQQAREEHRLLPGRTLGMIFQKPSTRTRVSFEVGIYQLGGTALYLSAGGSVELTEDPRAATEGAEVLYTDVWTSMGQDAERERRLRDLAGYCIDTELLERADRVRSSSTACRRTTARRSRRRSCTGLAQPCGTRRRTVSTRRGR